MLRQQQYFLQLFVNGGDDLWQLGPSEDLALAVKGVKPIGAESVLRRFAAESQHHPSVCGNVHAAAAAFLAQQIVQGPILWHPGGTPWHLSGTFQ